MRTGRHLKRVLQEIEQTPGIAVSALVVLAIVTLIVSQEPGYVDPDNPPAHAQPLAP